MNKNLLISIIIVIFGTFAAMAQAPALPPPIPGTDTKFYVADNGIPTGPFNLIALKQMVKSRKVSQATLVWQDGMSGWTQAGLVPELFGIFSSQLLSESRSVSGGYAQPAVQQSGELNPNNMRSAEGQKPLTDKEQTFITEKLYGKWNVNPTDKAAMKQTFNKNLAAAVSLAAVGTVLQIAGAAVMGGLIGTSFYYYYDYVLIDYIKLITGAVTGANLLVAGLIIAPLCAIGFVNAGRIGSIYKKTTGQKLFSFLQRTNINGGYDWENKEVTVAMSVRL